MTQDNYLSESMGERLSDKKQMLQAQEHKEFVNWCLEKGKYPESHTGLAESTTDNYLSRLDQIKRWIWDNYGYGRITHDHAEAYLQGLMQDTILDDSGDIYSGSNKRKLVNTLQKYFSWRADQKGGDKWTPQYNFDESAGKQADSFTREERRQIRDVALEYDTIPQYHSVSPDERDRWQAYLAQRLEKPKTEVTPADWDRVRDSWKISSLVWVSLDAGLRPIEVERASLDWIRLEKSTLYIPKDDAAKNRESWEVSLTEKSTDALRHWLEQRQNKSKYDGRNEIWLTREANPYKSKSLGRLIRDICDEAGIPTENRKITWYSIRHSVGDHMTTEGGIEQTKEQLRHKNIETTIKYTNPTPEERRDTLDRIG
ncbi:tyrosine-type recombinase/integrase [Halorutilales archaeon Cl-col2-1]